MKIRNENTATSYLYVDEIMAGHYDPPGIEFSDGVARVQRDVGEALVESEDFPTIHRHDEPEPDSDSDPDEEEDDE